MKKLFLITAGLIVMMIAASTINVSAQRTLKSEFSLVADTVTDTATEYLEVINKGAARETTVQVVCTKISGTVAGTISLLGSLDGTNFKALTVRDSTDAIPTFTATDVASQNFIWRLTGNPVTHYRVSWAGSGTMAASFTAKMFSH